MTPGGFTFDFMAGADAHATAAHRRAVGAAILGGGTQTPPEPAADALMHLNAFWGAVLYPVPIEPQDEPGDY